jgi:leucyl aminopeptidase
MVFLKLSNVKRTDVQHIIEIQSNDELNVDNNTTNYIFNIKRPFISIKQITSKISSQHKSDNICICISELQQKYKKVFLTYLSKSIYTFDKYITDTSRAKNNNENIYYIFDNDKTIQLYSKYIKSLRCADITRNLENEPANLLSPDKFCNVVKKIFKTTPKPVGTQVKISVLNEEQMKKEGLNLVLSIGLSSKRMPRFMTIELINDTSYPTICLIGKTVIYDAGGLNIKLASMTPSMKTDKSGGSVVVGIMKYFLEHKIKCNIVGILPIVENLLSEDVSRPGDIVKSYSGKMVEITDTDAEGRLIMADAIAYSKKYNPTYLFDLATLTGWSEAVHMDTNAVCYCKDIDLASKVNKLGDIVGERVWFLPPWDEYMYYTKSAVANIRNYSMDIREGAYLPSMFLLSFVPLELRDNYIHFDICNNFENDLAKGNCVILVIELIKSLIYKK